MHTVDANVHVYVEIHIYIYIYTYAYLIAYMYMYMYATMNMHTESWTHMCNKLPLENRAACMDNWSASLGAQKTT